MSKRGDAQSLGARMKGYEEVSKFVLPRRMPVIIRIDGKSFHTWTRGLEKPFDENFMENMGQLALYLCREIQTAQFAYIQSDEISVLLHNYKRLATEPFFNNEAQKMVSISAGMASAFFTQVNGRVAVFDSRVFVLPESEVVNYFIWRQKDATRNSIQMLARSLASHSETQGKNTSELQELSFQRGMNWNDLPPAKKRGSSVRKNAEAQWMVDREIPIFTQDRGYIENLLATEEE